MVSIQLPSIQTKLLQKLSAGISEKFDGEIKFESINFRPFNTVVIKEAVLLDSNPCRSEMLTHPHDTVFHIKEMTASFTLNSLVSGSCPQFRKVVIDGGSFHNIIEGYLQSNLKRLFHLEPHPLPEKAPDIFYFKKVILKDFHYIMENVLHEGPTEYGINWFDLDVASNIQIHDMKFGDLIMSGVVDKMNAVEKSGYVIKECTGKATVGRGKTYVKDFYLKDNWSEIHLPEYIMTYENSLAFQDFLNKISIKSDFNESHVDFKTVSYFVPALRGLDLAMDIHRGSVNGPVNNFSVKNLNFTTPYGVSATVNTDLKGLIPLSGLSLKANIKDLTFDSKGIEGLMSALNSASSMDFISKMARNEKFKLNADCEGSIDDLKVKLSLDSSAGELDADLGVRKLLSTPSIGGQIVTNDLDIGSIIGIDAIHECSLRTSASAILGKDSFSASIDSLSISRLNAMNYDYQGIVAAGKYQNSSFDGRVICDDPNLNFIFQGIFNFSKVTENALYKFYFNLGYADLHAINIDPRPISKISLLCNANYMRIVKGDLLGNIDVRNINVESTDGRFDLGDISIASHSSNSVNRVNFKSSFANGSYIGSAPAFDIVNHLEQLTSRKELTALYGEEPEEWKGDDCDLVFNFKDSRNLLSFVMNGLYIADSTQLRINIKPDGVVTGRLNSSRLAFKDKYIKGVSLDFDNRDNALSAVLKGDETSISGFKLFKNEVRLSADGNKLGALLSYDNGGDSANKGEIKFSGELERGEDGEISLMAMGLPSDLFFSGKDWTLGESHINVGNGGVRIDNFRLASGKQYLSLAGGYNTKQKDTLSINLNEFSLENISALTGDFDLKGYASGQIVLESPADEELILNGYLTADEMMVAGKKFGKLNFQSKWDSELEKLVFSMANDLDGRSSISADGNMNPDTGDIQLKLGFDRFDIGYIQPAVKTIFNSMGGYLNGKIEASGRTDNLSLSSSDCRIEDAVLNVGPTGVEYKIDGPFHIDSSGIILDDVIITDGATGRGTLSGGLSYNKFKDFSLDSRLRLENIKCLSIPYSSSDNFWGNIQASGNISVYGPFHDLFLDANITTSSPGEVHVPISGSAIATTSKDILTFKEKKVEVWIDPYDQMMMKLEEAKKITSGRFGLRARVNLTPDVQGFVEMDQMSGSSFNGRGNGSIELKLNEDNFSITGDYNIQNGEFQFNALGITNKKFDIQNGSSIKFAGDLLESDLDINARYSTKVSLATLISDTTSVSTRRTVNCDLNISDKLKNPTFGFALDIPDLDPTTKSKVDAALNTEDKVQKQFIALLLTGCFLPEIQSGITNSTNILYSNVAGIMATQVNNILERLEIPLDLGLNYQSTDGGTDIFDVALSTQLFNNRVLVNGAIGNRKQTTTRSDDVVGDLDIEVKLDNAGAVRLNLFSHSADGYTNYLDHSQRNGIGIAYQKEFGTWKEFLKDLFSSKKAREKRAIQKATEESKKVTIEIE